MHNWNSGLNPEQILAVQHNHGPMLILAGAGSGKTTVLVARTGRLITDQVARAENILVLTFTNKAARELKHRVAVRLGDKAKGLWAGTFHSFGLRILREFSDQAGLPKHFGVIDQSDSQAVLRELMRDIKIAGKDKFDLQVLLELINKRRVEGRQKTEAFDEYHELAEVLLPKYLRKLDLMGVVDFEGLLLKPIQIFQEHSEILEKIQKRHQQVMVDEFQDTNQTQMKLIDLLVRGHRNITVVGDDDQSIYGWRGAEVKNILDFPKLYKPCEVIRLERNYRSSSLILDVANEVIAKNKHRHGKVLKAENLRKHAEAPELFVLENEEEEVDFVRREIQNYLGSGADHQPKDIAVLYRSNSQGALVESSLREHRIPYTVSGGTAFFDRKEIKDVLAYLRFSVSGNDVSLRRIINTPARGIGDTTIEKINQYAKDHHTSFYKACLDCQKMGLPEKTSEAILHFIKEVRSLPDRIMSGSAAVDDQQPSSGKSGHVQAGTNLVQYLRQIGYRDYLYHTSASGEAGDKKWQLVEVFTRILDSFVQRGGAKQQSLIDFIDAMELRDDQEDTEEERNKVSLMTLHASKGLEFPLVMLIGVEEDLLPHKNLGTNIDEERRLFYVGLTRAQSRLILTRCRQRKKNGVLRPVSPSRFLLDIPKNLIKSHETGFRPVSASQREDLVSSFLKKLEQGK